MQQAAASIAATDRAPMSATRKAALIAGVAYIATFVFSIPVKFGLWVDVLDKPDWVLGAGSDAGAPLGAMSEVLTALGGIVTAVARYSIARRQLCRGLDRLVDASTSGSSTPSRRARPRR